MNSVKVSVNPPYSVWIGKGLLDGIGDGIKEVTSACRALIVTDTNVGGLYLERALTSLKSAGFEAYDFVFNAGEQSKNPNTYLDIIAALADNGFKRTDVVVALGGGVVGDIAGFAAATYMRGIDVVQIPTTLLAMIDSSIGGKTGVDLPCGKNLLGAFHQPRLVVADIDLLSTLPEREWRNGIGEGIKYACLAGGRIAEIAENGLSKDNVVEFVTLCAEYKANIVANDEKEGGLRKLLNFGHTLGHAIERESGFSIPHGVAVAYGIGIMADASSRNGTLCKSDYDRINAMLSKNGLTDTPDLSDDIINAVSMDKKTEGIDNISVVTIRSIGECKIEKMSLKAFEKYIK